MTVSLLEQEVENLLLFSVFKVFCVSNWEMTVIENRYRFVISLHTQFVTAGNCAYLKKEPKPGSKSTPSYFYTAPSSSLSLFEDLVMFKTCCDSSTQGWSTFSTTCESVVLSDGFVLIATITSCFCLLGTIRSITLSFNNLFNLIFFFFFF